MRSNFFQRYLLPGFVFQSVIIAGGYGTGRELVEYFLAYGPIGGLLGMLLVATVIWSVVNAVTFEFARVFRAFDYRTFFRHLLGPGWILFELAYIAMMLLVLAVIGATAGTILQENMGLPYVLGVLAMMTAVAVLVFRGSGAIEKFLVGWSFLLYAVYVAIFVWSFAKFGGDIRSTLAVGEIKPGWWLGGIKYAGYSLAVVASVLFTIRHAETRRDAVVSGLLTGPIAIIPAVLFYIAIVGQYPAVMDRAVPMTFLLDVLNSKILLTVFAIALFGTLIETGTGMIHAVNERVAHRFTETGKEFPPIARSVIAIAFLAIAALMSRIGLIDLIARGYGTMSWIFLVIFVIPILTFGVWKVIRSATPPRPRGSGVGGRAAGPGM